MSALSSFVAKNRKDNSRRWGHVLARVTIRSAALLMVLVLCAHALLSSQPNRRFLPGMPLPLEDVQDVVVNSRGRVFIGIGAWSSIQVYDQNGRYLFRFSVEVNGGMFRLTLNDNDCVIIAAARSGNHLVVYSSDGTRVSVRPDIDDTFNQLYHRHSAGFIDENGRVYRVRSRMLWPRVERIEKNGDVSLVIKNPWYVFPVAGVLHTIISLAALSILDLFVRRRYGRNQTEKTEARSENVSRN